MGDLVLTPSYTKWVNGLKQVSHIPVSNKFRLYEFKNYRFMIDVLVKNGMKAALLKCDGTSKRYYYIARGQEPSDPIDIVDGPVDASTQVIGVWGKNYSRVSGVVPD
jgi:hypothetical protein